jgi:parallel beta-helix repeat protein
MHREPGPEEEVTVNRRLVGWWLVALVAVVGMDCSGGSGTDAGVDAGHDPLVCVTFPERITADHLVEKGCYLVLTTPVISAGVTLTMRPGVKLVFSAGVSLSFSAEQSLQATGTAAEPILFTGSVPMRGHWKGLRFDGTSVDSNLDYVIVEHAGNVTSDADSAAIKLTGDSRGVRAGFSHTTLRESAGWGMWATGSTVLVAFTGNVLTRNTLGPGSFDGETVGRLDSTSTFSGNDRDELFVRAYRLSSSATWDALDVPYHLKTSLNIATADLTVRAGARFIMAPETKLTVSADVSALIIFTGETQTRGAWEGIVFDNSNNSRNLLRYVTVEWAGNTSSDQTAAAVRATADSSGVQVSFDHVTLRQSQGFGLYLASSAVVPQFTGNVLTQNAKGPANVDSNAAHQLLPGSTFTGNDVDKVAVRAQWVSGTVTWRDLGVPYVIDSNVSPQKVWTLEPGVVLEMAPQSAIEVAGGDAVGFHAVGTALKPITITGVQKARGSWDGINFDTTLNGANALEYCTVEYGGGGMRLGWAGMLRASADSHGVAVAITHNTIAHSASWGIWLGGSHSGTVSDNTFADNALGDTHRE